MRYRTEVETKGARRNRSEKLVKLYVRPAACSLSPHIVARELGLDIDLIQVDRNTGKANDGADFHTINPNGYVPALVLEDGEILIEGPAIVQYLADLRPDAGLAPRSATERRGIQSLLNFIATEIHAPMGQMFAPAFAPVKDVLHERVASRFDWIATQLAGDYLTGDRFSIADAYLFACLNWSQWLGIDLSRWPELERFMRRVGTRPGVRAALAAEGLALQPDQTFFAPA
jgi:glutathione S-transferase